MGDKTVSVRVRFEGGDQVKAGLQEVGREGTRALQTIGTVSAQTGAKLQNAGYQVSDFFVQVAGGTAPTRALAQQLPQLLQGFGLIGVAASVLIAALPAVWSLFSSGADDAEALEKQLQGVSKAVDAYGQAADLAIEPMDRLIEKYGEMAETVQTARIRAAELAREEASRKVNSLLSGTEDKNAVAGSSSTEIARAMELERRMSRFKQMTESLSRDQAAAQGYDFDKEWKALQRMGLEVGETRTRLVEMADAYKISVEQAAALAVQMGVVRESASQGAAQQVAAAEALTGLLVETYGSIGAADEATGGLVTRLNESVLAAGDLAAIDMASPIGAAAGEAARLASNLAAAAAAQKLAQMAIEFSPGGQAMLQYGSRTPGGTTSQNSLADRNAPKIIRSGGGGGGGGGADSDLARAVALTESVRTETEKYAIALDEVNRLKQKGLITDETYNRQLDKLNDKLGETGDLGKKAASAIRSAFDGLFDDPQQALKDLAKQLAMMALYQGLAKGFPSIFGSGGVVPLGIPGFAAGGRHRGGLRIVGENGPELEATGPSMIYPADALARMGRGGGSNVAVNVFNQSGGEVEQRESRGPNGERQIDIMIGKSLSGGRQDGAMRARYGTPPNRMKR